MAFSWYQTVTADHTQYGSNGASFVLLINTSNNDWRTVSNGGKVQNSSGYDIRPYSDIQLLTPLNFELVNYDATTGQIEMWISVSLISGSDLVFYLAFGDSSISTDGSSTSTWSNYTAVYHLPNGTTLTANDSAATPANGTLTNTPTAVAAQIDGGAKFVAASDQYIDLGNPSKLQMTGNFAASMWFYLASNPTGANILLAKDAATGGRAYTIDISSNTSPNYGVGTGNVVRFYINGGGVNQNNGSNTIVANTLFSTATWYFLGVQYRAAQGTLDIYVNGVSDQTQRTGESNSIPTATTNALMARRAYTGFTNPLDGRLDEVRITTAAPTVYADWLLPAYNNQKSSSTFLTFGSTTVHSGGGLAILGVG